MKRFLACVFAMAFVVLAVGALIRAVKADRDYWRTQEALCSEYPDATGCGGGRQ